MNTTGVVVLIVGFVILIIGAGAAIWAQSSADSMSYWERLGSPEEYDSYVAMASIGWVVAGVGVLLAIVGLVVAVAGGSKTSPQTTGQPGQWQPGQAQFGPVNPGSTNFCQYCGRQLAPGASWCPGCGRKSA